MSETTIPFAGGPDNLHELVQAVKSRATATSKLRESVTGMNVDDTIRYGKYLGFLEVSDTDPPELSVTDLGRDLFYTDDGDQERVDLYQDAIITSEEYRQIAESVLVSDGSVVTQPDVARQIDLITEEDFSQRTYKDGATTFLQTLGEAGIGEYVVGRRGAETRVELDESAADKFRERLREPPSSDNSGEGTQGTQQAVQDGDATRERSTPTQLRQSDPVGKDGTELQLEVAFNFDEESDPEKVQDLVAAVRRGWNEALDENDMETDIQEVETEDGESGQQEQRDSDEDSDSSASLADF